MCDPHRAVHRGAADRPVASRDDLAGTPAEAALDVHVEQEELLAADRVEHARVTLGDPELAHDRGGRVAAPVDRAVGLLDQRTQPTGHVRVLVIERQRLEVPACEVVDREHQHLDRGATDLVAVDAALPDRAQLELTRLPDVAGVSLLDGLEHGHAPLVEAELDRPVQRGRAAVAVGSGVNHETGEVAPHRLRDELLEHRAHHEVGLVSVHRRLDDLGRVDNLDGHVVTHLGKRDVRALAQAVVGGGNKQDPQRVLRDRG